MSDFDYIVVGGGTAGSVLAARLSAEESLRVLLLEAGPAGGSPAVADPAQFPSLMGGEFDWAFRTVPQRGTHNRVHDWARGRILGGSSAINAMGHLRGHANNYAGWGRGWTYEELLPYFRRSETAPGRDPELRGTHGPMLVQPVENREEGAQAFFDAIVEAGFPSTEDISGRHQEGAFWYDLNVVDGRRQSAADAYLTPHRDRANLTIATNATARRLLFEGAVCVGVVYESEGAEHTAHATREVVLSAGTIGSPHLLMLSGIGPADHLAAVGIAPHVNLPGVGGNLHDHIASAMTYDTAEPIRTAANGFSPAGGIVRSNPSLDQPDVQLLLIDHQFTLSFAVLHPHSRGTIRLASADPAVAPLIDPAYLTDERDMRALLTGLRVAREVGAAKALSRWVRAESAPGATADDEDYLRATATTYFHPVGTCRLGTDEFAVVTPDLRVRGVAGLRVADASVMPTVVGANTNATVLAIAEKAADLLRGR